jgi:imidazolonepropionase-like amidohydrolase
VLANTVAIRRRIESGEIPGPRILTAGEIIFPSEFPYYVKDALPAQVLAAFPRPSTPHEAEAVVAGLLDEGADLIKLYAVSFVTRRQRVSMRTDVARAAVAAAHRRGRIVYVHPTDEAGLEVALQSGADVLAHAVEMAPHWSASVDRVRRSGVTLIPTLTLFNPGPIQAFVNRMLSQTDPVADVRDFAAATGPVLFGTDAGYLPDFNPEREYELMSNAGLTADGILDSLTSRPAAIFRESSARGRLAPGMAGDVVLLAADPHDDVRNFARVRYTIRAGRVLYEGSAPPASGSGTRSVFAAAALIAVASLAATAYVRRRQARLAR